MKVMVSRSTSTCRQTYLMSASLRHTIELRDCTTLGRSILQATWGRAVPLTVMPAIWRIDLQDGMMLSMDVRLMTIRNSEMDVQYQKQVARICMLA
jgi:hypothetical protein